MNKKDTIVVTSYSNNNCLPVRTLIYFQTLNRWFDKDHLYAISTPPHASKITEGSIQRAGTVIKTDNKVPAFSFHKGNKPRRLGEVIQAWMHIDAENVFITDCDMIVYKDIHDLLDGDFDVAGRISTAYKHCIDSFEWEKMFYHMNVDRVVPMLNKGFILFKNNTFKKACKLWYDFMHYDIYNPNINNYKDQYALALMIGELDLKVKYFNKNEVAFGWQYPKIPHFGIRLGKEECFTVKNPYVLHSR